MFVNLLIYQHANFHPQGSRCELRIDLEYNGTPKVVEQQSNNKYFAHYKSFHLSGPDSYYRLFLRLYDQASTAGDAMWLTDHTNNRLNGQAFSTYDNDHDLWIYNCAERFKGGWWWRRCAKAQLNSVWEEYGNEAAEWFPLTGRHSVSFSEMKVRALS